MILHINKVVLYIVVVVLVVAVFCSRQFYALMFYERTEGRVTSYESSRVSSRSGGYFKRYPVVEFDTEEYHVSFTIPDYMSSIAGIGKNFTVLYNKQNPEDAYVLNFYGLWGESAKFLIPFFLIWTIVVLRPDIIPKRKVIKI